LAKLNKDFCIIKINDFRLESQNKIVELLSDFKQHNIHCVDGNNEDAVKLFFNNNTKIKEIRKTRAGYLGHWLSFLNALNYIVDNNLESLLILEDDAILSKSFVKDLELYMPEVPEDYDFFMAYQLLPQIHNCEFSRQRVSSNITTNGQASNNFGKIHEDWQIGSQNVVRAYQTFGSVGQIFSNAGAKKIIKLTEKNGLGKNRIDNGTFRNFDRTIYMYSFRGLLNGYQPNPYSGLKKLITIPKANPNTPTASQTWKTKYIYLDKVLGYDRII
jgi:GR25 family glycosyltransferase involved in LPS biosynthesis